MNKQWIAGSFLLVLIGGGLGAALVKMSMPEPVVVQGNEHNEQRIAELEARLAAMSGDVEAAKNRKAQRFNIQLNATSLPEQAVESIEKSARSDVSPAQPGAAPMDASEEGRRDYVASLEQSFASEDRDYSWSGNASDTITQYFDSRSASWDNLNSDLNSVECKSTLCKIEVVHKDAAAADAFALEFPMAVASVMPGITYDYRTLSNGEVSVTLYLSRPETN